MDPILYFLGHSLVLHLALAVVAFAFGTGVGWWLWARYQRECGTLQAEVTRERERAAKILRERDDLHHARSEQQAAHATLNGDIARLKGTVAGLEQEKQNLVDTRVGLENELAALRERAESLDAQAAGLATDLQTAREQLETLQGDVESAKGLAAERSAELEALRKSSAEQSARSRQLEADLAAARRQAEAAAKLKDEQSQAAQLLQSQAGQLGDELNRVKQQFLQAEREKEQLAKLNAELTAFRTSAEAELVRLKGAQGELSLQQSSRNEEATKLRQDVAAAAREREQQQRTIVELQNANDALQDEIVALRRRIEPPTELF